jgi:Ca2+-transporting ATPase
VSERHNLVFTGTTVTYGRGKAIVTGTAMNTEFGRIAEQVSAVSTEKSPLEKRTAEIGRWLGLIALGVCGVAIVVSIARSWMGDQLNVGLLLTMTMFAIALAVAAVPEALAAIVTGALAVGMHEMAKRNALVRRMPDGRHLAFVKGAPEVLLERCVSVQHHDRQQPLTDAARAQVLAVNEQMAKDALRC